MNHDTLPMINLIPDAQIESRRRSIWVSRWIALVVATAVLVGVPGLYIGGSAALTDSGLSSQILTARTDLTKHEEAIPQLRKQLQKLNAEHEVLGLVKNRIEWRDVFGMLVNAAGDDVRFTSLTATGGGIEGTTPIRITVDGLAPSQTIARDYVVRLESTGVFDRVELIQTSRRAVGDFELIDFELRISVRGDVPVTKPQGETNAG